MLFYAACSCYHHFAQFGHTHDTAAPAEVTPFRRQTVCFIFYDNNDDYLFALYPVLQPPGAHTPLIYVPPPFCTAPKSAFSEFTVE